jgi:UDP-N-acetylmuramoyl-tripeptide--D-alanyl-D-alanine ligase
MHQSLKTILITLLTWEAASVLRRKKPFIIAVTGSVGKTTTKDAIYHVLKESESCRKSEKSFNSEIGIPLTVLGLSNAWSNPFLWCWNLIKGFAILVLPLPYPKLRSISSFSDSKTGVTTCRSNACVLELNR